MNIIDSLGDAAWITHRRYSEEGQRIAAAALGTDGLPSWTPAELMVFVMKAYDCARLVQRRWSPNPSWGTSGNT